MTKKQMEELLWEIKNYFDDDKLEKAKDVFNNKFCQKRPVEPPTEKEWIDYFINYVTKNSNRFLCETFGVNGEKMDMRKVRFQAVSSYAFYNERDWRQGNNQKIIRWEIACAKWARNSAEKMRDYEYNPIDGFKKISETNWFDQQG